MPPTVRMRAGMMAMIILTGDFLDLVIDDEVNGDETGLAASAASPD